MLTFSKCMCCDGLVTIKNPKEQVLDKLWVSLISEHSAFLGDGYGLE